MFILGIIGDHLGAQSGRGLKIPGFQDLQWDVQELGGSLSLSHDSGGLSRQQSLAAMKFRSWGLDQTAKWKIFPSWEKVAWAGIQKGLEAEHTRADEFGSGVAKGGFGGLWGLFQQVER